MNFYNYLKNKTLLFESTINSKYYYDGKKIYPINDNTIYYIDNDGNKKEDKITSTSTNPKIVGTGTFLSPSGKNLSFKVLEKSTDGKLIKEIIERNLHVKIDDIYYPVFISKDKKYSIHTGNNKNVDNTEQNNFLNSTKFKITKQNISDYFIKLSSNNSSSSSGSSDQLPDENQEPVTTETTEETPQESK